MLIVQIQRTYAPLTLVPINIIKYAEKKSIGSEIVKVYTRQNEKNKK